MTKVVKLHKTNVERQLEDLTNYNSDTPIDFLCSVFVFTDEDGTKQVAFSITNDATYLEQLGAVSVLHDFILREMDGAMELTLH